MLHVLAEPDAARMWTNGHAELCGHQQHRQNLVDATQTAAINLAEVQSFCLQELLEHDAVVTSFAGSHANRRHCAGDRCMTEHIVRAGWLFDPERVETCQHF